MEIFFTLLSRIIPLYVLIVLGYFAAKNLKIQRENIASLLIYIIVPPVVFYGVYTTPITFTTLSIPLITFIVASVISISAYLIGKLFWKDSTRNIFAFAAGSGNTLYFGLPIALILFDEKTVGLYTLGLLGGTFFENTIGFFLTAKGHHTLAESAARLVRLPIIYGFLLGFAANLLRFPIDKSLLDFIGNFRGASTVLGMMIIGMGFSTLRSVNIDIRFITFTFIARFVAWPLLMSAAIFFDVQSFHQYTPAMYNVLILLGIVPIAASTVMYATELKAQPEKAAVAVFLSTLFALFYIPLMTALFIH